MADLKNPKLIYAKGFLFLFTGLLASGLLLLESPSVRVVLLLAIAVWAFCRFYYFAFYVIEHYVDPGYKFAGLGSFVRYLLRRRGAAGQERQAPSPAARQEPPA
jgi:hypothetical protein